MPIRRPIPEDLLRISDLLDRAFAPSISESELVRNLRDRGKISLDAVLEQGGVVAAYICFSRAYDERRNPVGFHLAPLAVLPGMQRRGLGQRLISKSIALLGTRQPVYVLGDPAYYSRSGFRIDRTQHCVFDPEGKHFMVLWPGPLPHRTVGYEQEFYDLAGVDATARRPE